MKDAKRTVIKNLYARVNPVNFVVATDGIKDISVASQTLQELINEGVVEIHTQRIKTPVVESLVSGYRIKSACQETFKRYFNGPNSAKA